MCVGGKLAKRVTLYYYGSNWKTAVIRNTETLDVLKNIKFLSVKYRNNKSVAPQIFEEGIRTWDDELTKKGSKILLLVDNCTVDADSQELNKLKIFFICEYD